MTEEFNDNMSRQDNKNKEAEEIFVGEFPDLRSVANAIAGTVASNDPEYKQLINEINNFSNFFDGAKSASDERGLDYIKSKARNRWHVVYIKAMTLAEEIMQEVADEYQNGQLEIGDGFIDHEETKKYWRTRNALDIVRKRTINKLNQVIK